jgi:hypothetical protein
MKGSSSEMANRIPNINIKEQGSLKLPCLPISVACQSWYTIKQPFFSIFIKRGLNHSLLNFWVKK